MNEIIIIQLLILSTPIFPYLQPTVQLFNSHTTNIAQRILDDESTNFPNLDDSISEVVNQNDVDNDQVQQQEIVKGEEEDEEDPLSFIQIKSAAQWKAVSKRISWNFDDASETATMVSFKGVVWRRQKYIIKHKHTHISISN